MLAGRYHSIVGSDVLLVLLVILVLVVIWRGPKTLPELGKALGRGVKEARREAAETAEEIQQARDSASGDDKDSSGG